MIELYTNIGCGHCNRAKALLKNANISYEENIIGRDLTMEQLKDRFPQATTFPIVVVNGQFIGGYSELEVQIIEHSNDLGKRLIQEG